MFTVRLSMLPHHLFRRASQSTHTRALCRAASGRASFSGEGIKRPPRHGLGQVWVSAAAQAATSTASPTRDVAGCGLAVGSLACGFSHKIENHGHAPGVCSATHLQ